MRNHIISTVGTSLFSNLRYVSAGRLNTTDEILQPLKKALEAGDWKGLANGLCAIPPDSRVSGAEINSIWEAIQRGRASLEHLDLLVSDTPDGLNTGDVLKRYFECGPFDHLQTVNIHKIDDLQDTNPKRFKVFGLRNLVRQIGKLVHKYGTDSTIIDATGGYKAQIAIAVVFGQALNIPVLYKHEQFSEIIDIPPMPISFNYDLLGENAALLTDFERGTALTDAEVGGLDEAIRVLLEEVEVDDEVLYELGAVGQIYLTGFRLRFIRAATLRAVSPEEKQEPSFTEDHFPIGFQAFVRKVWEEIPWFKTAHSLPYHKQKQIKGIGFYVHEGKLVGTYQDKDKFGARFEILTNAETSDQLVWAADQLNQKYRGD